MNPLRRRLLRPLSRQLSRPSGLGGRLVARAMNRGNKEMNLRAIELLEAGPGSRVIDIGFGGGRAVDVLLERAAHVTAIDPAADMVAALGKRHAAAVEAGRLDVHEGGVEQLPLADAAVDAALTVNTVYFWPDLTGPLAEIHRVLAPGGTLVIAIRDGAVMDNVNLEIFTIRSPDQIRTATEDAGFESWVESPANEKVHFIVARKPGDGAAPELFEG